MAESLDRRVSWVYALPGAALAVPVIPAFVLLPAFYAETLGLGLAVTGAVLLGVRLLDMATDPLIGWLADRAALQGGGRKRLIAAGALIAGPALVALFSPPDRPDWVYLLVSAAALFVGWSFIQIPYLAWALDLSAGYHGRTRLNAAREGAGLIGLLSAGALYAGLSDRMDIGDVLTVLAWITVAIGGGALLLALNGLPDRPAPKARRPVTPALKNAPWRNRLFLRLIGAWLINGLANGLPAVCFPLFLDRVLAADAGEQGQLIFLYFLCGVVAIPLWTFLSRRIGKHRTWCFAMILACVAFAFAPFLGPRDLAAFAAICIATGFALGADLALPPSIQADVADWDRFRFGIRRTTLLFSFWNMATKLALGLAAGFAFVVLDLTGLDEGGDAPFGLIPLIVIYAGLPVVLKLIAIATMWRFPLTPDRHRAITMRLDRTEQ